MSTSFEARGAGRGPWFDPCEARARDNNNNKKKKKKKKNSNSNDNNNNNNNNKLGEPSAHSNARVARAPPVHGRSARAYVRMARAYVRVRTYIRTYVHTCACMQTDRQAGRQTDA